MTNDHQAPELPTTDPDITADPDPTPLWVMDIGGERLGFLLDAAGCDPRRKASICYSRGATRLEAAIRAGRTWQQMTTTERQAVTVIVERYSAMDDDCDGVAPGPADRGIPASERDCDAGPGAGPQHPRVLKGSAVVGGQRVTWAMSDGPCAAVVVNGRPAEHAQAAALLMKALDLDPAALPERHKRRVMLDIEDADGGRWLDDGIRELHKLRRDADEAAAALDSVRTEIDVTRYASEELDASDIVCQLDRIMATLEAMRGDG